jgi:16S rRNA (uracil1498-N3)-methyltransferase
MGRGDELHLTDGRGVLYRCKIVDDNVKRCTVEICEQTPATPPPYHLVMAVAPTKNIDRFEWFLEKATEVGVAEIYPIESAHSERRQIKLDRELKVITSAVKQSLKMFHPTLHDLTPVKRLIAQPFDGEKYIAHCNSTLGEREYLGKILKKGGKVLILIGPEGDFSPEEITFALQNGFKPITLGDQRLRTETAAVVATVMVSTLNSL